MQGVDAVPHSAKDTPFTAYGRNGDTILGSYTYLGDMRYDEDWFKIHDSPFWDPVKFMSEREPKLNRDHLKPTYTELDLTSVKREGRAPAERTVEDNLTHILKKWFPDRHAGVAMIGTADGRRETLLNVGNRTERKMTAFGTAVQFIVQIANKHGVNPYKLPRPKPGKYTGIGDYLRWHAKDWGMDKATEFVGRTSKSVRSWFRNDKPGSILAILSGSQGNPIEVESMTYKLADARSFFDASPKTSKTARPANLKDWAIIFTQGAIPGNTKYQQELIRRIAARGATVLEAFGDGMRVHNPGPLREKILADLKEQGQAHTVEQGTGAISVPGLTIHASGHGRKEDFRLWLNKLQSKLYGGHHTDDPETVLTAYDTIKAEGKTHPGQLFKNQEQVQITTDSALVIGRILPSIVMTRVDREDGKQYDPLLRATRIVVDDDRSPHNDLGLRGSIGGVFETAFGAEDAEETARRNAKAIDVKVPDTRSEDSHPKPMRHSRGPVPLAAPPWPGARH
jgi:hypothetical protein